MPLPRRVTPISYPREKPFPGQRCVDISKHVPPDYLPSFPKSESWPADVAWIELAPEVAEDFERILDHLTTYQVEDHGRRIGEIIAALDVLEHNPLIGRPVANGKRELVIGRQSKGYLALYRYVAEMDVVFVLAIRSQREAGYAERE